MTDKIKNKCNIGIRGIYTSLHTYGLLSLGLKEQRRDSAWHFNVGLMKNFFNVLLPSIDDELTFLLNVFATDKVDFLGSKFEPNLCWMILKNSFSFFEARSSTILQ